MNTNKILQNKLQKQGNEFLCSCAAIFNDKNEILIGLRNYTADKYKNISVWTLPGGRCDCGETLEQTLKREVYEEVGIDDLEITSFMGETAGAKQGDWVVVFSANTKQKPRLMEPQKFSCWRFVEYSKIPENFINMEVLKIMGKNFSNHDY